ncbi:MAG: GNAT family N-acetyltransferase [Polyangiales bacterium]
MRPLHPGDEESISDGFAHLSRETRRRRFFTAATRLPTGHTDLLVHADGDHHLAWGIAVEVDGIERGIGVARLIRNPEDRTIAEFAITIADEWQHRGAGLALAQALAARSREIGIRRWLGVVLLENRAIIGLLHHIGREVSRESFGDGSAALVIELA